MWFLINIALAAAIVKKGRTDEVLVFYDGTKSALVESRSETALAAFSELRRRRGHHVVSIVRVAR